MQPLRRVTAHTSTVMAKLGESSVEIGNLAGMSVGLRRIVERFKL